MIARCAIAAALTAAVAGDASAYTLIRPRASAAPLHWPASALPVLLQLNDQIGASVPNVEPGSDPLGAIERALPKYPAISNVRFQTGSSAVTSSGRDGVNLVTFADTAANRALFEMAGGNSVLGLTLTFTTNDVLVEADLVFNPSVLFTTLLDSNDALLDAGLADVEAVATHELGHLIGLHHTGVESATMWALVSVLQRVLDADDIAGARTLYPDGGGRGAIGGRVTMAGAAAFGAHVVAVDARGAIAASALTLPNGTYAIEQLAPATYRVYVEPLDGPHSAVPTDGCVRFGNLNGAGIYNGATLTTNFPTRFADNVVVTADEMATVDFALPGGAPPVNPVQVGAATISGGRISASFGTSQLGVVAGGEQVIAVAGPGLDQVPINGIDLGPDITIDPNSRHQLNTTCNGSPFPLILFHATVNRSAAVGGRPLLLSVDGETTALTGGLRITPAAPVCVGDCSGDGQVTVDELVKGVTIALGTTAFDECPAFDLNGDGMVTVDELVQAVNAALNGCD